MKNKVFLIIIFSSFIVTSFSQKHITKTGTIEIFSETPIFTIEGTNKKVASILNTENGDIVASTLVRSFKFEEALVEEHFNENYIESHKFPKAVFKGKIKNYTKGSIAKDGEYNVSIIGKLTIHGVTKNVEQKIKLIVKDGIISGTTKFNVSLKDYGIKVEKAYKDAINDAILLKVHFNYKLYKK